MPDWRIGAVIMKIMSSTRTTSTNGTMLISESEVCVDLESCGMATRSLKSKVESRKQEKIEQRDAKPIARPDGQVRWLHECRFGSLRIAHGVCPEKDQSKVFSTCAVTSRAKVSSRWARSRIFCKKWL